VSTKSVRKDVESSVTGIHAMNHAKRNWNVATFALDYVGSPALHCVTLVMKNSCFTKNTKQRMLS